MRAIIVAIFLSSLFTSCGYDHDSELEIVGGQDAPQRRYYGMFLVNGSFRCGSTLVDKRWVLTAEHCLPKNHRDKITIKLGAVTKTSDNGGKPYEIIPVVSIVEHPQHDLALLELKRNARTSPLRFSDKDIAEGTKLHAFGFGATEFKGPGPKRLQGIVLKAIKKRNGAKHMIYVGKGVGYDVCHGDSGGPLVNPKTKHLVGVASWTASQCGTYDTTQRPSGFVRPDVHWIKEVLR